MSRTKAMKIIPHIKVKVTFPLEEAMEAQWESRGISLLFL